FRTGAKLVTLLGSGGVGKTRLALRLAERNLEAFRDGVYFVPLAPLEDASFVIATIAEEIGYEFSSADTEGDLLNYLREKRKLLILDNFEHVTDAASLVGDLLSAAPDVCIVATSRERLRLRGEQIYEVGGMTVPDSMSEDPEWLVQIPAVKLFIQSALRVMPDFAIEDQETAHRVADIIRLVQGLPLGIELAAAWLEALPLDEIVTEIQRNFDFLETDLRDVPERHRSIRALFDYSWNLMTPEEQTGFVKLSVFRDGFAREAAQKVADTSLRTLTNLVNKSLLRRDPNGRFYAHEMLRQYAEEKLQQMPDVKMATYKAHAQYYAQFAAELSAAFNTQRELSAVQAMDAEIENVRLMWRNVVEHSHFDVLDAVQDTMLYYYLAHSLLMEGYEAFKKLADALELAGQQQEARYWRARIRQAWLSTRFGEHDEVVRLSESAVAYFTERDPIELSHAHNQLSYAYMGQGDYDAAIACSQAALDACKQSSEEDTDSHKHVVPWFMSMGNMGYAYFLRGDYKTAREIYENVLQAGENMDYSQTGVAYFKNNLGEILRETGEMKRAHQLFQEAYDLFATTQQKRGMAFTLNNLGGLLFLQGQHSEAQEAYQRSYQLHREIGDRMGTAHSLSLLGNVAGASGEASLAKARYRESLDMRRELGDKRGIADSISDLARIDLNNGDFAQAERLFAESLQLYREIQDRRGEGTALASFALTCLMLGKQEQAETMIREALAIGEEIGNLTIRLQGYIGLGELAMLSNDPEGAMQHYKLALNATRIEEELPLGLLLFVLVGVARVRQSSGDTQGAIRLLQLVLRYPRTFIGMVEDRAKMLLAQLQHGQATQPQSDTNNTGRVSTQELQGVIETLLLEG
ncbi:MAG: tetratricopeptide repeat protein, partial [Anaerolineae bacterium]|nr:tetratricopeptide repeat protein [Anaerolineae bacterium]